MKLSPQDMQSALADNRLKLSFIGMSNIGKTYWSGRLADHLGLSPIEIDTQIQAALALGSIENSAHWMGHPGSAQYKERAGTYLAHETQATLAAIKRTGNQIIDTTGSVVHLHADTLSALKCKSVIVYLRADDAAIQILLERFSKFPKPLIWGKFYTPDNANPSAKVLMACYERLLKARAEMYTDLADIVVPVSELVSDMSPKDFLDLIIQSHNRF